MGLPRCGLGAIHRTLADPITYTGAGLAAAPITAIYSDVEAGPFPGPGSTARKTSFEVQRADLPGLPKKGDAIAHETGNWLVINIDRLRDIDAWLLTVERAP